MISQRQGRMTARPTRTEKSRGTVRVVTAKMDLQKQSATTSMTVVPLNQVQRAGVLLRTWFTGFTDTLANIGENASMALGVYKPPYLGTSSLEGRVAIVTGGNAGIGQATAQLLAARGAHVVLACRSRERGEAAAAAVRTAAARAAPSGVMPGPVEVMTVDMASLDSVRRFCADFNRRRLPLHLLVANAGIMSPATKHLTQDGLEMQFQVNFLSHWLMAHALVGEQRLRRAGAAHTAREREEREAEQWARESGGWGLHPGGTRVVMLTSLTHHAGVLNWHDMQSELCYDPFTSYGMSKLANTITAAELNARLSRTSGGADSAVAVHPGVVDTAMAKGFFKHTGTNEVLPGASRAVASLVDKMAPALMRTPAASATTVGFAALAPSALVGGRYVADGRVAEAAPEVGQGWRAAALWDVAQRLTAATLHPSLRG